MGKVTQTSVALTLSGVVPNQLFVVGGLLVGCSRACCVATGLVFCRPEAMCFCFHGLRIDDTKEPKPATKQVTAGEVVYLLVAATMQV